MVSAAGRAVAFSAATVADLRLASSSGPVSSPHEMRASAVSVTAMSETARTRNLLMLVEKTDCRRRRGGLSVVVRMAIAAGEGAERAPGHIHDVTHVAQHFRDGDRPARSASGAGTLQM